MSNFCKCRILFRKVCVHTPGSTQNLCTSVLVFFLVFRVVGVVWLGWGTVSKFFHSPFGMDFELNISDPKCYLPAPFGVGMQLCEGVCTQPDHNQNTKHEENTRTLVRRSCVDSGARTQVFPDRVRHLPKCHIFVRYRRF